MRDETTNVATTATRLDREGSSLPAVPRLRRGTTLVELMIAMLILAIVCISWLEIIGIQSARKEARRREAVERLAGMMDAFMAFYQNGGISGTGSFYLSVNQDSRNPIPILGAQLLEPSSFSEITDQDVSKPFPDYLPDPEDTNIPKRNLLSLDPIGYRLVVVNNLTSLTPEQNSDLFDGNVSSFLGSGAAGWEKKTWLIGLLYDKQGKRDEAERPFFRLPVCL